MKSQTASYRPIDESIVHEVQLAIRHRWHWVYAFGVAAILGGLISIASPLTGGLAVEVAIGILLLLSAVPIIGIIFSARDQKHRLAAVFVVVATLALGFFLLVDPTSGLLGLSIVLGAYFSFHGLLKMILSFRVQAEADRSLAFLGGTVLFMAGLIIAKFLGHESDWAAGVAAGLGYLVAGVSWLRLAMRYRHDPEASRPSEPSTSLVR